MIGKVWIGYYDNLPKLVFMYEVREGSVIVKNGGKALRVLCILKEF